MNAIVDFHSHILPGVDDGSRNVEESLAMLRMEAEQGICHVIATPHFYARHDNPERFLRRRARAYAALREGMADRCDLPRVSLGAEVYYYPGMSDSELLSEMVIADSRYMLLEMPHSTWTDAMYREIEYIYVKRGIVPIIAHIDRYLSPFHTGRILRRMEELPVLVQANSEFFLERSTAKLAMRMLKEDRIHLIGSDCHNLSSRAPNIAPVLRLIRKSLGDGAIDRICNYEMTVLTDAASEGP